MRYAVCYYDHFTNRFELYSDAGSPSEAMDQLTFLRQDLGHKVKVYPYRGAP